MSLFKFEKIRHLNTVISEHKRIAYAFAANPFALYFLFICNWISLDCGPGGFESGSPKIGPIIDIVVSLLPLVTLTSRFILGKPWLKACSFLGILAVGLISLLTILEVQHSLKTDKKDDEIITAEQIDTQTKIVTYESNPPLSGIFRENRLEMTIVPGLLWSKRLSLKQIY